MLLHAATALLLFLVLRQMTGRPWPSALAAALWAIHPLRVESVAWVTERKDVLSGLFFVLTLGAYASYVRHRFSLVRYAGVMVLFALGLMAKPMLVTLPCVLLLLDYWPLGTNGCEQGAVLARSGSRFAGAIRSSVHHASLTILAPRCRKAPAVGAGGRLLRGDCLGAARAGISSTALWWRIGDALISYVVYLRQFFCPTGLALLVSASRARLAALAGFRGRSGSAGITAAVLAWRRKCPYLLVGWLWYLGMLLPVVGLVPFGGQMAADRFTYLPQIGICIGLAGGRRIGAALRPYRRWACGVGSALALAALMGCAWQQTSYWRDSETLWTRTLACTSENYWVHNLLGNALATARPDRRGGRAISEGA